MRYTHPNVGTCSRAVSFELVDGKLHNVEFDGGCNGNTKGICKLVEGMDAQVIVDRLLGNTCGPRPTSCPDQLARAVKEALAMEAANN